MSRSRALLLILLLAVVVLVVAARPIAFRVLERLIDRDYPAVKGMSTAELAAWLSAPVRSRPHPLLLDVRTPAEFAVSHLAGARRIEPGGADLSSLEAVPRDTPIVTYCSIGWRSAALAERLQQAGFHRVWNLHGSLFAWANEGRPLASKTGAATRVHPYDRLWGLLLARDRRAPVVPVGSPAQSSGLGDPIGPAAANPKSS